MQACYEIEVEIPEYRQLTVQLPDYIVCRVKVVVTYEIEDETTNVGICNERNKAMADFWANLPLNTEGGLSKAEIQLGLMKSVVIGTIKP